MVENSINQNVSSNYFSNNNFSYYDEIKSYRNSLIEELKDIDKQSKSQDNLVKTSSYIATNTTDNLKKSSQIKDKLDIDFGKLKELKKENQTENKTEKNTQTNKFELSDEDQKVVDELKARDAEVRAHEQAHLSAGAGIVTGGPTYSYQTGPDGQKYAIGGEVQIDSSAESTPEKTISKMQQVIRAALAPSEPSSQDVQVASSASKIQAQARAELSQQTSEQIAEKIGGKNNNGSEVNTNAENNENIDINTQTNFAANINKKSDNSNLLEVYFKSTSKSQFNFSF